MDTNPQSRRKRKITIALIACGSIAVVLFLCIFSLYHLPTRNPVETPEMVENPNDVESPAGDIQETNDIMSASQEEVSAMLGNLEMQYQNASLNGEPYAAQQAGMRLALAYWKAGDKTQAQNFLNTLIDSYPYDESFVAKCRELKAEIGE